VDDGRLEIYLDGQTLFDRKAEGGRYPGLDTVRELKKAVRDKVAVAT
jgi:predicted Rdx family selenoprotein